MEMENEIEDENGTSGKVISSEEIFNRKQRRYLKAQMVKTEKAKQKRLLEKGEQFVTRKEFVGLFQSCQKIRDRLYYLDIHILALEKLILDKQLLNSEELENYVNMEVNKANEYFRLQNEEKNYENRLTRCVELEINPDSSIIGRQILNDTTLSFEEKYELASKYNLATLLKVLDDLKKKE